MAFLKAKPIVALGPSGAKVHMLLKWVEVVTFWRHRSNWLSIRVECSCHVAPFRPRPPVQSSIYRLTTLNSHLYRAMIEIPEPVVSFIRERINSVEQLEMLLLLKRHPEKEWTAQEMSRALSSNPDAVASRLVSFEAVRLVAVKPGPGTPLQISTQQSRPG